MNDVAREAGVSLKTVSRFVNGETNIDPALAARIAAAITQLGYRRNLAAASIRPGWTSKMLGLIISDLANPYYSTLARAIEEEADARGYMLIVASSEEDGARHDRIVDRLMEQRVDGLLIVPPRNPARDWAQVTPPVPPMVFLDRPGGHPGADTVLADNAGGAADATRVLHERGARRIAFVGDSLQIYTMRERHRGYADALRDLGVDPELQDVFTTAHSSEDARSAVEQILAGDTADAVFAANNRASIGALLAFRETGRRLPLIGFDDFEAADLDDPGVSVVSQDIPAMGRDAARLLLARLGGDTNAFTSHTLPTTLVLRGSERAAR
ncbi:LacI family DNA-binding transcriptional regulator [Rathayibacter sp. CAU 1779]